MLALALLIGLQFVVAWVSVRSSAVGRLVKAEPSRLLYRCRLLPGRTRQERMTEEVRSAVRAQGVGPLADVDAVVLETDGPSRWSPARRPAPPPP